MRIWDANPGYLDRKRLLGEHRELHGLFNILSLNKKGYSRHPETLRWVGRLPALCLRHQLLLAEMELRGYQHHSPLPVIEDNPVWPDTWISTAVEQFDLLADKQRDETSARIPLPVNTQQLWAQHKYSVMAHDPALYSQLGPEVAHGIYRHDMEGLAEKLVTTLRQRPSPGHLHNALQHMWGYISDAGTPVPQNDAALLQSIGKLAMQEQKSYLLNSTALSELQAWLP